MFAEMKWTASFFLVLFLLFTVTPAIVSVVSNADNTELYSVIEEEIQKEVKISLVSPKSIALFSHTDLLNIKSRSPKLLHWENIPLGIVSPPPEYV